MSVEVRKSQHKYVIGPRGTNIQEILGATGVSVEVPPLDSNSETITLRGEQDKLGPALTLVYSKVMLFHFYLALAVSFFVDLGFFFFFFSNFDGMKNACISTIDEPFFFTPIEIKHSSSKKGLDCVIFLWEGLKLSLFYFRPTVLFSQRWQLLPGFTASLLARRVPMCARSWLTLPRQVT